MTARRPLIFNDETVQMMSWGMAADYLAILLGRLKAGIEVDQVELHRRLNQCHEIPEAIIHGRESIKTAAFDSYSLHCESLIRALDDWGYDFRPELKEPPVEIIRKIDDFNDLTPKEIEELRKYFSAVGALMIHLGP